MMAVRSGNVAWCGGEARRVDGINLRVRELRLCESGMVMV